MIKDKIKIKIREYLIWIKFRFEKFLGLGFRTETLIRLI